MKAIVEPASEMLRDATIHRFEWTFDAVCRALQHYLEHEGHSVASPREVIRRAFKTGIIPSESEADAWMAMLEDRTLGCQGFRPSLAWKIHERIVAHHAAHLEDMVESLQALPWN